MPYNLDLEYRIDKLSRQFGEVAKKKMFGGICYLLNGNMCFGIYKEYLIVRTSAEKAKELLTSEYITPFNITGKPMKGWVMVSPDYVETDAQLVTMLKLGVDFVKGLPGK
jgi:TfoX/Sxy family transcriptional regulator of competence genes